MPDKKHGAVASVANTHQEIVEALDGLGAEFTAAYRAASVHVDARRAEIQQQCGVLGHLFAKGRDPQPLRNTRICVYCGTAETKQGA